MRRTGMNQRLLLVLRALALILIVLPTDTHAQDAAATATTAGEVDPTPNSTVSSTSIEGPTSLEAWLDGDGITGDSFGWRSRLADQGFSPYAIWIPEVFHSLAGGLKIQTEWEGLLKFGAGFDLEKMIGWQGAAFHASALWIQGNNAPSSDFVGNFDELSNIAGNDGVRLFQLFLTQDLDAGTWRIKVGQIALDTNFMISDTAVLFLNSSFGALPVESANSPAPIWPLGALGGMVEWKPRPHFTYRMGLYNGDAGSERSNRHGFGYPIGDRQGVMVMSEFELASAWIGRENRTKIGGYYNSGNFTDFSSGQTVSDNYALYFIIDQIVIGSWDDNVLAAFFRVGWSPLDDRNAVHWYLDGGFSMRGLGAGDRVGLGVSHTRFGNEFVNAQTAAGSPIVDDETILELTYDAQLTPWLSLQPDLQCVIDPLDREASDAVVGAMRGRITF